MKRILTVAVVIVLAAALLLCACAKEEETLSTEPVPAPSAAVPSDYPEIVTPSVNPSPSVAVTATPGKTEEPVTYKEESEITVRYYDIVDDAYKTVTYTVEGEATAQSAMDAVNKVVVEDMYGGGAIKLNSVKMTDGNVFIDFSGSIYDIGLGSGGEVALLDAIADAYLDNVVGAKAVFFSVDGSGYSSGHLEIPKGEAYKYHS